MFAGSQPNLVTIAIDRDGEGWEEAQQLECGLLPRDLATGDVNGDGYVDLAIAREQSPGVVVWLAAP